MRRDAIVLLLVLLGLASPAWAGNGPPEPPLIFSPRSGDTVGERRPTLVILNAHDPDLDPLVYDWDLSRDVQFSQIVQSGQNAPQAAQHTAFRLTADLIEDSRYCWRVRADDGQAVSMYRVACFLVSERNDPPSVPTLNNPSDNMGATTVNPVFSWAPSADPEDDSIVYDIEVKDDTGTMVAAVTGVAGTVTPIPYELENHMTYAWRARATDRAGASSAFSPSNTFSVNAPVIENPAPMEDDIGTCQAGRGGRAFATAGLVLLAAAPLRRRRRRRSGCRAESGLPCR